MEEYMNWIECIKLLKNKINSIPSKQYNIDTVFMVYLSYIYTNINTLKELSKQYKCSYPYIKKISSMYNWKYIKKLTNELISYEVKLKLCQKINKMSHYEFIETYFYTKIKIYYTNIMPIYLGYIYNLAKLKNLSKKYKYSYSYIKKISSMDNWKVLKEINLELNKNNISTYNFYLYFKNTKYWYFKNTDIILIEKLLKN